MHDNDPARRLSSQATGRSDPAGWFERRYAEAERGEAVVPWDLDREHSLLREWTDRSHPDGGIRWRAEFRREATG